MDFDLRECSAAKKFVLEFLKMSNEDFINEINCNCKCDFELFWQKNIQIIKSVDISDLKIWAFHVVGSLDNCKEICSNGLMNLQRVLNGNTILKKVLEKNNVVFDIGNHSMTCDGKPFNLNYDNFQSWERNTPLWRIYNRIYHDFCVNGFLYNDAIKDYGTDIHARPEFLMTLGDQFPKVKKIEKCWKSKAKGYKIDFYATLDQIKRFTFDLDEKNNPPYDGWLKLNDDLKIKKWMLSHAIDRALNNPQKDFEILYIEDCVIIPPEQMGDPKLL